MKKEIHPSYHEVVFADTSSDYKFLTRSTLTSTETIQWEDGKTYPLIKIEVSSASHPFYTGKKIFVDTAGRVERFQQRYKNHTSSSPEGTERDLKTEAKETKKEPVPTKQTTEEPTQTTETGQSQEAVQDKADTTDA